MITVTRLVTFRQNLMVFENFTVLFSKDSCVIFQEIKNFKIYSDFIINLGQHFTML